MRPRSEPTNTGRPSGSRRYTVGSSLSAEVSYGKALITSQPVPAHCASISWVLR